MTAALELRQLSKRFGKTEVVRGVSFDVQQGERLAIIGPNGAGKSTLFNLISGVLSPDSGLVLLKGARIDGKRPYAIQRLGLSRSFQVSNIFPRLSVFENLRCSMLWGLGYRYTFWRFLSGLSDANAGAERWSSMLGLQHKRDVLAGDLTYAEQRALEIGMTISGGAKIILLDEPTAGMSVSETAQFVTLIKQVTQGCTLLVVEHDMGVVFGLADRIAVLQEGELIAVDTPDNIRANTLVQDAYLGPSANMPDVVLMERD